MPPPGTRRVACALHAVNAVNAVHALHAVYAVHAVHAVHAERKQVDPAGILSHWVQSMKQRSLCVMISGFSFCAYLAWLVERLR